MTHLRHHGFPSPLLDWTRSWYVAAFFAFEKPQGKSVAIYSFLSDLGGGKLSSHDEPCIEVLGHFVETHRRHYQQQSEYTICYLYPESNKQKPIYVCHKKVRYGNQQDRMKKYIIPASERKKVLAKLFLMNINAFSLFGDEDSLMRMLAHRELEMKFS
jgi:hypothetical protein